MRISRLELAGAGDQTDVGIDRLGDCLNVITDRGEEANSALAACIAHLLYGRPTSLLSQRSGLVDIETDVGNFRLRRESTTAGACRLTIASLGQATAAAETISKMLRGSSPDFLAGLYFLDGTRLPRIDLLLSESVAAHVSRLCQHREEPHQPSRQKELLAQRDDFAMQVAQLLSERQRTSASIATHLEELAGRRAEVLASIESAREELHAVEIELAELSAHTRYRELEMQADQAAHASGLPADTLRLDEIDDQIERWRATLHELERRESHVRSELARQRPIDSSAALPLADQRAALAVAEQLLKDLQSEIARFARPAAPGACVCRDAHPRLHPLVALLDQQMRRLTMLTDEHERSVRAQELLSEAQHLTRSQAELRDQLENLQTQRESHSRRARPRRWRSAEATETPVPLQHSTESSQQLERKRHELSSTLEGRRRQLRDLDQRQQRVLAERTTILSDRLLEQKQAELAEIQRRLQPSRHFREPSHHERHGTRSSDYLAQLSDGQFMELKLTSGGRRAVAVDRHARSCPVESLPLAEQQLVALSLTLAIIAGLSETGFQLPVILDEPFAHLNDSQTAILAGVLRDFSGQQVFVFTDRQAALEHFRGWGITIHNPHGPRQSSAAPPAVPRIEPTAESTRPVATHESSERSRGILQSCDFIERFPALGSETREAMEPASIRSVADLLMADPTRVAKRIARRHVTPAVVALWQSHAGLLCFAPTLSLDDAQVLTSIGIHSTQELAEASVRDLRTRIAEYLETGRGQRFVDRGYRITQESSQQLIAAGKRAAGQFQSDPSWSTWLNRAAERQELTLIEQPRTDQKPALRIKRERPQKKRRARRPAERDQNEGSQSPRPKQKQPAPPKFYLELQSPIAEAPSITPEIAEQLSNAGVRQVRDLLAADASKLATRLAESEIAAVEIVAWQHQARLCCRIPNLRTSEAAILVGAGFSTPEDVASMKPAELHGFVQSFAQMDDGRELLGDDGPPDLSAVEQWIRAARHSRVLGAA
ncbi:MAG: DUF4332 domain-containing protein [Pirellulales bacterium]